MSDNYVAIASAARSSIVDVVALEEALRKNIRGDVRFDSSSRALYATDGSNYRQVPIGVVLPRDADDVISAVSLAREYRRSTLVPRHWHFAGRTMLQRRPDTRFHPLHG